MRDGAGAGSGARMRTSRRTLGRAALTLPAGAALAACGQAAPGGAQSAPAPGRVQGKVLALAYQKASPGFDRQKAMYDDFNKEFQPRGLEVELVEITRTELEGAFAEDAVKRDLLARTDPAGDRPPQ